ncbi:phage tail terminator protein [Arhodomonas sp. AD133]|uniref:phage tail terminator protein n=1 Tax=Arhodomonas sp. AD133 TaxID=3415009 RepID=UPI003EBEDE5C
MSTQMQLQDLDPWIERLTAEVPALVSVGGAADLSAAFEAKALRTPAAYVIPGRDQAGPNKALAGAHIQRLTSTVGVVVAVRNLSDGTGEAGHRELRPIREAILTALVAWSPPDGEPVDYAGGSLVRLRNRVLWWEDRFTTQSQLRRTS